MTKTELKLETISNSKVRLLTKSNQKMTTVVKFLVKFIVIFLVVILFSSCNFDLTVSSTKGNGNVVSQERLSNVNFTKINASEGLDVYLTKSTSTAVKVQADDNLQQLIITEIKDGTLFIHTSEAIGKANAKKILVNFTELDEINSSSGADIHTTNFIISDNIIVNATSGSDQNLNIEAKHISCSASSGAEIELNGKVESINANASSGAEIDAEKLISQNCTSDASSGAEIELYCTKSINADASSGADISFSGNPKQVIKSKSSAANISKN